MPAASSRSRRRRPDDRAAPDRRADALPAHVRQSLRGEHRGAREAGRTPRAPGARHPRARDRQAPRRGRHAVRGRGGHGAQARTPHARDTRSEEHTSELQSLAYLVCRLLLEKKKKKQTIAIDAVIIEFKKLKIGENHTANPLASHTG